MLTISHELGLSLFKSFAFLVLYLSSISLSCLGGPAKATFLSYRGMGPQALLASEGTSKSLDTANLPESAVNADTTSGRPWASGDFSGDLGFEQNYSILEHKNSSSRPYILVQISGGINYGVLDYKISILGRKETIQKNHPSRKNWRSEEIWLARTLESSRIVVGLQKITWGETFGIPIVDIVNHQDIDEHPLNGFEENKLSSWMINYQIVESAWNLQLIASPWNQQKILQSDSNRLLIDKSSDHDHRKIFEFGGRIGYLLNNGLDIKAFYYHHENRYPIFEPSQNSPYFPLMRQVQKEENSFGVSQSLAFDASVLRWDLIYVPEFHLNSPTTGELFKVPRLGSALGYDYSTDFDLLFGLQLQSEILSSSDSDLKEIAQLHYFATQFIYPANSTNFQLKSVTFLGRDGDELWQRMEFMIYIFSQIRTDIIWDDIQGDKIGLLSRNRDSDRLYLKLTWQF